MVYYMDNSMYGCIYIYLSGLHFIHVLYGIITLGDTNNSIYSIDILPIYTTLIDTYYIIVHRISYIYSRSITGSIIGDQYLYSIG